MKNLNLFFSDVKEFLSNEINRLTVIVIIMCIGCGYGFYKTHSDIKTVQEAVKKCEKKVDFRYFNLTRSLEDINHVQINTKDGRVEK